VAALLTVAARFRSWLDVEPAPGRAPADVNSEGRASNITLLAQTVLRQKPEVIVKQPHKQHGTHFEIGDQLEVTLLNVPFVPEDKPTIWCVESE
jgi:hypothetical protein